MTPRPAPTTVLPPSGGLASSWPADLASSRELHEQQLANYERAALGLPNARDACFGAATAKLLNLAHQLEQQITDALAAGCTIDDLAELGPATKYYLGTLRLARQFRMLELLAETAARDVAVEPLAPQRTFQLIESKPTQSEHSANTFPT